MARYSASDIAKWLVAGYDREAGGAITPLMLQKLLYYAQGWWLVDNEEPLFSEEIQAWKHGPAVPSVYREYKSLGWSAIDHPGDAPDLDEEVQEHLSEVLRVYGEYSGKQLERMTHSEAPWIEARGGLPLETNCENAITHESMRSFFSRFGEDTD